MSFPDITPLPPTGAVSPVPPAPRMLIPLAELKLLLGATVDTYDQQITFAGELASDIVRDFTGRELIRATYTNRFLHSQYWREGGVVLTLAEYPLEIVSSITVSGQPQSLGAVVRRLQHATGTVWLQGISTCDPIEIEYVGGYDPLPATLKAVILNLVQRQLAAMGVTLAGAVAPSAAPISSIAVGNLRIGYAVKSETSSGSGGLSPISADSLADFTDILNLYSSPWRLAAMP